MFQPRLQGLLSQPWERGGCDVICIKHVARLLEKFWNGIEVQHLKWEVGDRETTIQPVINDKFKMGLDVASPWCVTKVTAKLTEYLGTK